jgi:hypothetical protein
MPSGRFSDNPSKRNLHRPGKSPRTIDFDTVMVEAVEKVSPERWGTGAMYLDFTKRIKLVVREFLEREDVKLPPPIKRVSSEAAAPKKRGRSANSQKNDREAPGASREGGEPVTPSLTPDRVS